MVHSTRLQKPVLVLNASYEPINVCAARRALVLVLKGVASAEELSPMSVHSTRRTMTLPSVIRLLEYRRIPHQTRALSRKNILMRDRYTCQYCHKTLTIVRDDAGPCDSAISRRRNGVGESGCLLPSLQQQEGMPDSGRSGDETRPAAAAFQPSYQPALNAAAWQKRRAVAQVSVLLGSNRVLRRGGPGLSSRWAVRHLEHRGWSGRYPGELRWV